MAEKLRHTPFPETAQVTDYIPAIQDALTGYADSGRSWRHGKAVFEHAIVVGRPVDAALRSALSDAAEGAESSTSIATEKFWLTAEGPDGPHATYGDAINNALTGYAKNGGSWLAARDEFFERVRRGDTVDAALRVALSSAGEEKKSSRSKATGKFWLTAEGPDGPHATYGDAINNALTGYAKNGGSWLAARDEFFEAVRGDVDPKMALRQALIVASEGAKSSPAKAIARFQASGQNAPTPPDKTKSTGERREGPLRLRSRVAEQVLHGEDRHIMLDSVGIFGVFDGMGGHDAGDVAAQVAADTVGRAYGSGYRNSRSNAPECQAELRSVLQAASNEVARQVPGGGTTGVVARVLPTGEVVWANAGDSRLYVVRDGRAHKITRDEGYRNFLDNALGNMKGRPGQVTQTGRFLSQKGDRLLVVSDGVTGDHPIQLLSNEEIAAACQGRSTQEAADELIAISRKPDDRTALVVDIL
jgi:serine/threonine protein phosphatase PrpC